MDVYKISGVIGLLLITYGVLAKTRKRRDTSFIVGGIFLLIYSIYRNDFIFASLQIVFIIATLYDKKQNDFKKRSKIPP